MAAGCEPERDELGPVDDAVLLRRHVGDPRVNAGRGARDRLVPALTAITAVNAGRRRRRGKRPALTAALEHGSSVHRPTAETLGRHTIGTLSAHSNDEPRAFR
jgi:hypothetical protein